MVKYGLFIKVSIESTENEGSEHRILNSSKVNPPTQDSSKREYYDRSNSPPAESYSDDQLNSNKNRRNKQNVTLTSPYMFETATVSDYILSHSFVKFIICSYFIITGGNY